MQHRVFVYGTLLSGQENARQMTGATLIGAAATTASFDLLDCSYLADYGRFPGLRPGGRTSVKGELYLVDDRVLAQLDEFEGHPDLFLRSNITLAGGGIAQAYLAPPEKFVGAPLIPGGDWRRYRARRLAGTRPGL